MKGKKWKADEMELAMQLARFLQTPIEDIFILDENNARK